MSDISLIYIHGFNSSPQSWKAGVLRNYFERHGAGHRLHVPALDPQPRKAMATLEATIAGAGPVALLGSSLGGFYATWLAEHHDLVTTVVNPAVRPWRLLDKYTGINHNYHSGEAYQFDPAWLDELRHYQVEAISKPEQMLMLTQTGDESLDWREGWEYYADCHLFRGLGGSHGFDDFDAFIPLVLRFCGIRLTPDT